MDDGKKARSKEELLLEEKYERTWYEKIIRAKLKKSSHPYQTLYRWCLFQFYNVDLSPDVYGFVIPLSAIKPCAYEKYLFIIYTKTVMKRMLFVSRELYKNMQKATNELIYHLSYFPLFSSSGRNIFFHNDISLYN